jgi:thiol-disulfide isomerase/thioredoxin
VRLAAALAAAALQVPMLAGVDVVSGKPLSLADYRGRPVVINVWGAWCGGCITEAPALARFTRLHPGVPLLGIDAEDSRTAARAFYRRYHLHHPSIFDPQGVLSRRLHLRGLPTTLFLDRRHRIVARVVGAGTLPRFERALRAALGS